VLLELLRPFGFSVQEAADGVQALEQFERHRPQLILMDLRMPGLDGYQAMQRIRQCAEGAHVRIVAVTASAFDDDLPRIRESGANDVLRKPFRRAELFQVIENQLLALFA
jgi:CheY-like chemotaxis protein